ncbi:MAG: complex I NDUFA9 subunit family protein [Steroidobacteraceae bacterium]
MNICVLGGTGFVGTALINRLSAAGHWVSVPTRHPERHQDLQVLPTVRLIRADVHDPRDLDRLVEGMDAVINLVGILNEQGRNTFQRAHVELAVKVVDALKAGRVRRLLHMSSLGADPHGPSRYLRSKGEAEALVRAAAAQVDFTVLRPSVIFGPGDSLTNRFAGLLHLSHGWLPLARAQARFAPVYVGDVAAAFIHALRTRATIGQTYELGGPQIMTLEQLVRTIAAIAHLPCHLVRLPDSLARLQGVILGCLPGKPFTLDNFRSLTRDSVCTEDGFERLGLPRHRLLELLPTYLTPALSAAESPVIPH